jgi:5-methylcytosine-specific restriction endonuclease McrA
MLSTRKRVPADVRRAVYARDNYACVLCGDARVIHLHHVVHRSLGGTNTADNLVCLCPYCHAIVHGETTSHDFPFDAETAEDAIYGYLEGTLPGGA